MMRLFFIMSNKLLTVFNGAAGPTTIIYDTFTDTDTTALASHTIAPTNTTATSWTVAVGAVTIVSNQAKSSSAPIAVVETNSATVTVTADINTVNGGGIGIILRYSDVNNFCLGYISASGDTIKIWTRTAGVYTARASSAVTINGNTLYAFTFSASGDVLTATVGSPATTTTVTYTTSFNNTATKCGFFGENPNDIFDNFKVTTP